MLICPIYQDCFFFSRSAFCHVEKYFPIQGDENTCPCFLGETLLFYHWHLG